MIKWIMKEPVAVQGFIQAVLACLTGFGVLKLSAEQVSLLLGVTAAFLALVTRQVVTPLSDPKNNQGQKLVPAPA